MDVNDDNSPSVFTCNFAFATISWILRIISRQHTHSNFVSARVPSFSSFSTKGSTLTLVWKRDNS